MFIEYYPKNYCARKIKVQKTFSQMSDEELIELYNKYRNLKNCSNLLLQRKLSLYDYLLRNNKLHLVE